MAVGIVKDYSTWKNAAERLAFSTPLFREATGSATVRELSWGTRLTIANDDPGDEGRIGVVVEGDAGFVDGRHLVRPAYVDRARDGGGWRYTAPLYARATGGKRLFDLLWGDRVQILERGPSRSRVRARGYFGWISNASLTDQSLLELYFIDVGQGDGVLIRTPDHRHILIDGGYPRERQPTNKSAADFVDWKFFEDYGDARIALDAMIASHCDLDHYGGLDDLLGTDSDSRDELDCAGVDLEAFYHAGVSWWEPSEDEIAQHALTGSRRQRWLGPERDGYLERLLDDRADLLASLPAGAAPRLQGAWRYFLDKVGTSTQQVVRLGVDAEDVATPHFLPGFDDLPGETSIRVLGPVSHTRYGRPTLTDFGDESQNTNGHSVLMRVDYRHARVLLTGDLNKASMQALLASYGDHARELACDVAKACHHGSDDASYAFLQKVRAAATVILSGDAEGHAHPRAAIVAASGQTGHVEIDPEADELLTPLVFSTEVERSYRLGRVEHLHATNLSTEEGPREVHLFARESDVYDEPLRSEAQAHEDAGVETRVHYREARPAWFQPKREDRSLKGAYVVAGVHYGLVNVRTDGHTIVCATMREDGDGWTVHSFPARF